MPFDTSSGSASISLTQPLLKNFWIDQTRFNIKVAKNRIKYSELGLKQTIMSIVTTVEQAYYDLIYARENVTVQEKAVELATQLVVENKKRVEVGSLAPLDEKQAEAQAASSRGGLDRRQKRAGHAGKHREATDHRQLRRDGAGRAATDGPAQRARPGL